MFTLIYSEHNRVRLNATSLDTFWRGRGAGSGIQICQISNFGGRTLIVNTKMDDKTFFFNIIVQKKIVLLWFSYKYWKYLKTFAFLTQEKLKQHEAVRAPWCAGLPVLCVLGDPWLITVWCFVQTHREFFVLMCEISIHINRNHPFNPLRHPWESASIPVVQISHRPELNQDWWNRCACVMP